LDIDMEAGMKARRVVLSDALLLAAAALVAGCARAAGDSAERREYAPDGPRDMAAEVLVTAPLPTWLVKEVLVVAPRPVWAVSGGPASGIRKAVATSVPRQSDAVAD
jgi:hypothetical protein